MSEPNVEEIYYNLENIKDGYTPEEVFSIYRSATLNGCIGYEESPYKSDLSPENTLLEEGDILVCRGYSLKIHQKISVLHLNLLRVFEVKNSSIIIGQECKLGSWRAEISSEHYKYFRMVDARKRYKYSSDDFEYIKRWEAIKTNGGKYE